ncbi:MAG: hypothetical protein R3D57_15070 [Hyphomicrobiaceae bacterium]
MRGIWGLTAAIAAMGLTACTSEAPSTGALATPDAVAITDPASPDLASYISGRSFAFSSGGTVTETFLADGTGEWRRPSGRSGKFRWTLESGLTFCRVYEPSPAAQGQRAWEGGTWCGTIRRAPEGLSYTDLKTQTTGLLQEVTAGSM